MISSIRIIGFPEILLANVTELKENEKILEEILQVFLLRVKSDPSMDAQNAAAIRTEFSFPVCYLNDTTSGRRGKGAFVVVEIHMASCIITESRYWAAELTAVLRRFFVRVIPPSVLLPPSIRYEVIEVAFIDNGR